MSDVHPSDAELSRRQRCDARLESDAVPAFDADGESIQYRGPEIPGAALPVPAQEARTAELIAWMAERSKMCDDALALNVLSDGTRVEAIALKAVYEDTIARLRSHSEIPEAPCPKCAQREARMFPIMDGPDVPWSLLEPHEKHAMKNHGQTLERLAERGGLAAVEALQILDAKPFGRVKLPVDYANRILAARVRSLRSADSSGSDRPAAPTVPETSNDTD